MRKLLLVAAVTLTALMGGAYAAERFPAQYIGRWCQIEWVDDSAQYERNDDDYGCKFLEISAHVSDNNGKIICEPYRVKREGNGHLVRKRCSRMGGPYYNVDIHMSINRNRNTLLVR